MQLGKQRDETWRDILKCERLGVDSHGVRAAISILFKQIEVMRREWKREEKKTRRIKMAIGVRRGGNTKKKEIKEQL